MRKEILETLFNVLTDPQITDTFEVHCVFERGRFDPTPWVQWLHRDYLLPLEEKGLHCRWYPALK